MTIYVRFLWTLLQHKWYVLLAGFRCRVPVWRLIVHDWSKFTPTEFGRYARNFQGDYSGSPIDRAIVSDEFVVAWCHHENLNRHHWGHWIPRSGTRANQPLPIPETHVREMIADCLGASKTYTGQWDIAVWINNKGRKWKLHDETVTHIATVMVELGYFITDNCDWSWMAGPKVIQ